MIGRRRLLALALAAAAAPVVRAAQAQHNPSRLLRVEAALGQGRGDRSEVSGYVLNDYGRAASGVQLRVELLDGAGQVTSSRTAYVSGSVPPFGRCLLYTSPSPRDGLLSRMPSSA